MDPDSRAMDESAIWIILQPLINISFMKDELSCIQTADSLEGNGFIGGLSSKALVRVAFDKDDKGNWKVGEAERYEWDKRVREVEQDSKGNIFVLEDKEGARLIKLVSVK